MISHRHSSRLPILILILLALFAWLFLQPKPKDLIPWEHDYAAAVAESKQRGKPLLIYFTAKWCAGCQILETATWSDRHVAERLKDCVCLELDSDDPKNLPLAMEYRVEFLPRFVLLDNNGRTIRSGSGSMPPEMFLDWLSGKQIPDEPITGAN